MTNQHFVTCIFAIIQSNKQKFISFLSNHFAVSQKSRVHEALMILKHITKQHLVTSEKTKRTTNREKTS